jgi:hypothetical protein
MDRPPWFYSFMKHEPYRLVQKCWPLRRKLPWYKMGNEQLVKALSHRKHLADHRCFDVSITIYTRVTVLSCTELSFSRNNISYAEIMSRLLSPLKWSSLRLTTMEPPFKKREHTPTLSNTPLVTVSTRSSEFDGSDHPSA